MRDLMERVLEKDPLKRATLEEIAQSSWLSNNGRESIDFKVESHFISKSNKNGKGSSVNFGNL